LTVVDASVAVKWIASEAGEDEAAALLDSDEPLLAPALLAIEVAAAITRKYRMSDISEDATRRMLKAWNDALRVGIVQLSPDEDDLVAASELAIRLKHPLQDCLYLALAQRLKARFVTADETLHRRASDLFPSAILLRDRKV
jgi:predicted nucleic acid-binding protein